MKIDDFKDSKTFCVYPFIHLATLTDGSVTPCCIATKTSENLNYNSMKEVWNSEDMKTLRKKIIAGEQVYNCSQCYRDESFGIKSHRIKSNEFYEARYSEQLSKSLESYQEDGSLTVDPFTLDIRAGNTCNLKCVMCRPNESSKWVSDAKAMSEISQNHTLKALWKYNAEINTKSFTWVEKQEFWNEFESYVPNLQEIIFGGGEPFLSKSINQLIEFMVESGHSEHIKIRFHTNGTQIPESFWPLIKHFKEIEMMFSVDGFGEKNYYVRYPAQWAEIEKNVDLSLKYGARTMILASLHALNILDIDELYRWWLSVDSYDNIKFPIVLGRVYNPTYMNPQILPERVKQRVWAKIQTLTDEYSKRVESNHFRNLVENVEWMRQTTEESLDTLIEYIRNLDKIRNTKFDEVFTELNDLLEMNQLK